MTRAGLIAVWLLSVCVAMSLGADPCKSGLDPGQRPGPYSSVIATGASRGQSMCFICETAEKPAVVVFARQTSDALGKLAQGIDKALTDYKSADLRAWITFLSDDQPGTDPKVVHWSQKQGIRQVPLGIFEDAAGPPSYRLSRDADVTVVLFVKQQVVSNFAFRAGELTDEHIAEVLKAVPAIVGEKK
jgi:hypothetical protein